MDSRRDKIIKKAQSILDKYKITPSKKGTARVEANDALSKELFMDEEAIQIKEFQSIGKFSNTIIHNVKKIVVDVSTGYNLRRKERPQEIYYIIEFSGFNPTFPKTTYFHNKYIQPNATYYTKDDDGVWRKKQSTLAPEISDESSDNSTDSDETDDDDNEMQFGKLVKPVATTSEIPYQLFDLGTDGTIIVGSLEDHVRYYLLDLLNKIKKIWNKEEPKDSKDSRRNLKKDIETIRDVILRSKFKTYAKSITNMRNKAIKNKAKGTSAHKTKEDKKSRFQSLKKENKENWKDRTGYPKSGEGSLEYIFEQAASTEGSEKVGVVLTDTSYQIYRRTSRDEDGNIISIELIRILPDKRIKERKMGNEIYSEPMKVDFDSVEDDASNSDHDSSGEDEDDNNSASDDSGFDSDYSNDDASNSDSEDEDEDGNKISLNRRDPVETRSKDK
tara:strand:+ start:2419 stop:3753 length:1335 start_codon:yes stop_codon:yes gene_type:complete